MSEVQSRPAARGRGAGRGARGGGYATRGGGRAGNRNSPTNGDTKHDTESSLPTVDDEGDVGQLKKQYGSKVPLIKEMFPDWSEVDILYALQETDGDENVTVTRIADGEFALLSLPPSPGTQRLLASSAIRRPAAPPNPPTLALFPTCVANYSASRNNLTVG